MATEQRRSSGLKRAVAGTNIVEALVAHPDGPLTPPSVTTSPEPESAPSDASTATDSAGTRTPVRAARAQVTRPVREPVASETYRRSGPGRPRRDRIVRPLTTTIEVGLRERVDAYIESHNATMVDVLDQALRLALDIWEGNASNPAEGNDGTVEGETDAS